MALTFPQLSLSKQPDKFSPVYGPNYFMFTASFATVSTTAIIATSKLFYNLEILNQDNGNYLATLGRFDVPVREGNIYLVNPSNILKTQVTFPFNTVGTQYYGSGAPTVINEDAGFGSPTSSFPTTAPEKDGIVAYRLRYGLQYDPNVSFTYILSAIVSGVTYSQYFFTTTGVNFFADVGDVITINVDSGLYSYYNGTASIKSISTDAINMFVVTDQIYNNSFGPAIAATGEITSVQHYFTYSSPRYAYNGVRQYQEKDVDFADIYLIARTSSSPVQARYFMNDYGTSPDQAIPIMPGQAERARFLIDNVTGILPDLRIDTYTPIGVTISSQFNTINWAPGGPSMQQKCFTVQLFDGSNLLPIVDGQLYKFTLNSYYYPTYYGDIASIWYVGSTPCSKYENVRIKFLNRQGSWAYWNFNKDNKQTTQISKTEYNRPLSYDYTINPAATGYQLSKLRGQAVLSSNVQETFSLNSDWISESAYSYLGQLVTSPEVYIFQDSYTNIDGATYSSVSIPIIVTDTSYTYKTLNRDRLFNLTLNYKYAFDTKIQNQ